MKIQVKILNKLRYLSLALITSLFITGCVGPGAHIAPSDDPEASSLVETGPPGTTVFTEPLEDPPPDVTAPTEDVTIETLPATTPTDPPDTVPEETESTDVTLPPGTEPIEPDTSPTEPEPTMPEHAHSYTATVIPPTCSAQGYTQHTCSCGDSYTDSPTSAVSHDYVGVQIQPTCTVCGYMKYTCSYCGRSYNGPWNMPNAHTPGGDPLYTVEPGIGYQGYTAYNCQACGKECYSDYVTISDEKKEQLLKEAAVAAVKYINQLRVEQGDTEATILPGLVVVAEYRAEELQVRFSHSNASGKTGLYDALNLFEYGEYKQPTGWDPSDYYYSINGKEAICKGVSGATPDEIGRSIAECFHRSDSHWRYVGSSEYQYIAVGVTVGRNGLCCCVLQTNTNYDIT